MRENDFRCAGSTPRDATVIFKKPDEDYGSRTFHPCGVLAFHVTLNPFRTSNLLTNKLELFRGNAWGVLHGRLRKI